MEYVIRHCPKCNGELYVPADLKTCICMYCGENFDIGKDEGKKEAAEIPASDSGVIYADYRKSLDNIAGLTENYDKILPQFTRERYSASFEEYTRTAQAVLMPAEQYASLSGKNLGKAVEEITGAFLEAIEKNIRNSGKKLSGPSRGRVIDQHRFFMAVYLVPAIRHLKYTISEPLADRIIEEWRNSYPRFEFKKAGYEELSAGFKRKGFCFITAAVCETMDKPDDCYELTRFRRFRDNYLQKSAGGAELIREYYRTAPVIVAYINMHSDSKAKYKRIWREYLLPCLDDMEKNRLAECRERYIKMVRSLEKELPFPVGVSEANQ